MECRFTMKIHRSCLVELDAKVTYEKQVKSVASRTWLKTFTSHQVASVFEVEAVKSRCLKSDVLLDVKCRLPIWYSSANRAVQLLDGAFSVAYSIGGGTHIDPFPESSFKTWLSLFSEAMRSVFSQPVGRGFRGSGESRSTQPLTCSWGNFLFHERFHYL